MINHNSCKSYFIATETLEVKGEKGEYFVWEAMKNVFANHEVLAYWRYPLFTKQNRRTEPDIIIFERKLGIIIIEVKSLKIEQIKNINGHIWQYQNFYTNQGNPYQQAENQLFTILDHFALEPNLDQKIKGKVLVALPFIKQEEWHQKNFHQLPSNPPIIFADDLIKLSSLKAKIINTPFVTTGEELTDNQWNLLLSTITGKSLINPPSYRVLAKENSKGKLIQQLSDYYYHLDLTQEAISKQEIKGIEAIRGMAGTGKTLLLCQKAAYFHLKYPQWKIAFIFFSRSLYEQITTLIDQWLRHFSNNQIGYDSSNKNLLILHGWGSKNQEGFYSLICSHLKTIKLRVNDTYSQSPNESLAEVCCELLNYNKIPLLFDLIILDEAQDFLSYKWSFQGKQPFLSLVYRSLIPHYTNGKEVKRLIYAYDEMQCLNYDKNDSKKGLFLDILPSNSPGEIISDLCLCFRTPRKILNTAFAINMGWLRPLGILSMVNAVTDWQKMGYEFRGKLAENNTIHLTPLKSEYNHPLDTFKQDDLIKFNTFYSRQEELNYLAENIFYHLRYEGLRLSRQILVIVLGNGYESQIIQNQCREALTRKAISVYFPQQENPRQFWQDGSVTVCNIHQAKGNEAFLIYVVGSDRIAQEEDNIMLRNQLFVALTRTRGWVYLSGVGDYPMYWELREVLGMRGGSFRLRLHHLPPNMIGVTPKDELLRGFALGRRNFKHLSLSGENLRGCSFDNINLIGSNLERVDFQEASLQKAKFINAELKDVNFAQANLKNAKFIGANLVRVNFDGANLTNTDFSEAKFD